MAIQPVIAPCRALPIRNMVQSDTEHKWQYPASTAIRHEIMVLFLFVRQ